MSNLGKAMIFIAVLLTIACIAALINGHFQLPSGRMVGDFPAHIKGPPNGLLIVFIVAVSAILLAIFWPPRR